jgi:lipoate-protein ligase B
MVAKGKCWLCHLGRIPYGGAWELQRKLARLRYEDRIDDILLLLEHPPTVTLGRFGKRDNLLITDKQLDERGISLYHTDRGGDITFHCPGQLVVYPIMNIKHRRGKLRDFLADLEQVAIETLHSYSVPAERWTEHPGIWTNGKQIGAVGLRITRGITLHGLSLNVNPDLGQFEIINLCGLPGKEATSISKLTGRPVRVQDAARRLENRFSDIFGVELQKISRKQVIEDSVDTEVL